MKHEKMCLTCKHYETYFCDKAGRPLAFLNIDKPTTCKQWRLNKDYKKTGKWYDEGAKNEAVLD